ncbi:MAG: hypothetical protein ACSW8F_00295 [bacterium]
MKDKQLKRLSRRALLELLVTQMEENEALAQRNEVLEKQMRQKSIAVSRAGSMADAAMTLNQVFASADNAAEQYLENIRRANERCDAVIERANRKAEEILAQARAEATRIRDEAGLAAPPQASAPPPAKKRTSEDLFGDAFNAFRKNNR